MVPAPISVAVYAGAQNPVPVSQEDLPWPDLVAALEGATVDVTAADKRALVAVSPVRLRAPYRKAENVEHVTALFVDFDHCDVDAIEARLATMGVAACVYGSPSDAPDARRVRVVAPVSRPIAPDECRATRLAFAEALGHGPGCGAEGAIDAAKLFFVGRLEGTAPRYFRAFDGRPVDVDALGAPTLAWGAPTPAAAAAPLATLPPADAGIAAALGDWRQHEGRKWSLCGAVGGLMRRMGFSAARCEAELRAWLPAGVPGVDVDAGVRWALAAWDKPAEAVSGHDALAGLLGAAHADLVERAAFAASWAGRAVAHATPAPEPWRPVASAGADGLGTRYPFEDPEIPLEYYCEGLRLAPSQGKISLVAGLPGAGKGPLADHLALAFATGAPAFGRFACARKRVILLDCEGVRLSMRRLRRMARAMGVAPNALEVRDVSGVALLTDATFYALEASGAEVIVLDSYTSAMLDTGLDSNKPEFAQLAKLLGALGVLVLAVAHANKTPAPGERVTLGNVAGSFALAAMAQTGIAVWHPKADDDALVQVACMRAPETGFAPMSVTFEDTTDGGLSVTAETAAEVKRDAAADARAEASVLAGRIIAYLRAAAGAPKTKSAIAEGVHEGGGAGKLRVGRALSALQEAGLVRLTPTARPNAAGEFTLARSDVAAVTFDEAGRAVPTAAGFVRPGA